MSARRAGVLALLVLLGTTIGCSRPGDGGYHLTAYFPRAVALYPESRVKTMGIDVGTVTKIEVEGDRIRVEMQIDKAVPLPSDVQATIVPLSLIGERNVVLSPSWQPGKDKAKDGDEIPLERTHVPVEPDEALSALTNLARAVDPETVKQLVSGGAQAVDGHGATFNAALKQVGDLTSLLASQDQALLSVANNLHTLASTLNSRQAQLGKLLDDFSNASGVLAAERDSIAGFLRALVALTNEGNALLTKYQFQLPQDLASAASLTMVIQANADSVQQLVQALREISDGVIASYEPTTGGVRLVVSGGPDAIAALQPLFDVLGLGAVHCVPGLGVTCP